MLVSLVALGISLLAAAVVGMAGPSHRLGLSLANAYAVMRWGGYIGVAAIGVSIVAAVLAYRQRGWLRVTASAFALVAAVTSVAIAFTADRRATSAPPIHDITTDLENPPTFAAIVARRADAPNRLERAPTLAELQRQSYPDLVPVTLPSRPDQTFDRALAIAQTQGWDIVTADKSSGRIEGTDTTRWFGFVDDIAVRVMPWGTGTRVDVRSVSRTGLSDAGRNARRIRRFLTELQKN
jgi:uncharacterized protein (DUF1499 family)